MSERAEIDRSVALAQSRPWRISPWLVILTFAVLVLTPAAVQVVRAREDSSGEKRDLAAAIGWLDLATPRTLSQRLEAYVNDHFGLRGQLVRLNSLMRYHAGVSSSPQVAIGRDQWLFYARERILQQHTGIDRFKPAELDEWARRMEDIRRWLQRRGIALVMVLAPDKNTIYPEKLPQYPKPPGTVTRADQVAARLAGGPLPFVDPRAAIMAAKGEHPRLYFEGDSHWGHRAAFIAYDLLMKQLAALFPAIKVARFDDFVVSEQVVASDQAYLLGLERDITVRGEVMTRKIPAPAKAPVIRTAAPGAPWGWPIKFYENDLPAAPRLVVFADSFTDYILGPTFLYGSVRDPVFTHHNTVMLNYDLIEEVKPDAVVIVLAERYLRAMPGTPPRP